MSESIPYPAATYELNTVASIVGRFAIDDFHHQDFSGLIEMLDERLDRVEDDSRPVIPVSEPEAIRLATEFNDSLSKMADANLATDNFPATLYEKLKQVVDNHSKKLAMLKGSDENRLVSTHDIERAFEFPGLFSDYEQTVEAELQDWGRQVDHPVISADLKRRTSRPLTQDLLLNSWKNLFHADVGSIGAENELTEEDYRYHLFWSPTYDFLHYATPANYPVEQQLSFDIPHNAAHLYHLYKLGANAEDYIDRMPERAFFESVAVLSEYMVSGRQSINSDGYFEELSKILGVPFEEIKPWVEADRSFEFKLRTARFLGDVLISQGAGFEETVHEVSRKLEIDQGRAAAEVSKYLPWLGLNAVYIKGFRRLIERGAATVQTAVEPVPGVAVKTWSEFETAVSKDG